MARANLNPVMAGVLSALLAGAGQVYNGQRKKGVTYMAVEAAFLILLFTVLRDPLYGLVTLNPVGGKFLDSSTYFSPESSQHSLWQPMRGFI